MKTVVLSVGNAAKLASSILRRALLTHSELHRSSRTWYRQISSAVRTVVRQVLRWNGTNVGIDQPGDDPRHAAAERHKFNLAVNPVVLLEIAGI
jgi:hypothetical protein